MQYLCSGKLSCNFDYFAVVSMCSFFCEAKIVLHFIPCRLTTAEIEARAQSLSLFETLKTDPQLFYEHMTKYVYPTIEGKDLYRLLYYYTLLEQCGCSQYITHAINPECHVKLLKKLKAVAQGMTLIASIFKVVLALYIVSEE